MSLHDSDLNFSPVQAGPIVPGFDPHPPHMAQLIRVHDGDTAWFRIRFEAGVSTEVPIRTLGFNSPELSGPHSDKAKAATKAFADLLESGDVWVKLTGGMTFGRWVGQVFVIVDGKAVDVAQKLTEMGFAVEQGQ